MNVQRDPVPPLVHLFQKGLGVGEQLPVPAVTGPPAAELGIHRRDRVPVHIEHGDGERKIFCRKAIQQFEVGLCGVRVVAAPPVPQAPARQHRGPATERIERVECLLVVEAVREDVEVGAASIAGRDPAVVVQQQGRRVIEYGETPARHHSRLERQSAIGTVQGPRGTAKIFDGLAVAPHAVVARHIALHLQAQPSGTERPTVIDEPEAFGHDLDESGRFGDREPRDGQIAMQGQHRGAVFELAVIGPFEPEQPLGQHGDAPAVTLDHGLWMGFRRCRQPEGVIHPGNVPAGRRTGHLC